MGREPLTEIRSAALGKIIRQYIADVLALNDHDTKLERKHVAELEAKGYRIVTGGQTDGYGDDGKTSFELRDWRTSELIFEGRGTLDDFERMWEEHDPDERFYDHDTLVDDLPGPDLPPAPDGLPASLAQLIGGWATENEDEARDLVGTPDHARD